MDLTLMLQSNFLQHAVSQQESEICNSFIKPYGLSLTGEQIQGLVKRQHEALRETERIEFGRGILRELIATFASSPHLPDDGLDVMLADLQDLFYRFKSETDEQISDDVLLDVMRKIFDDEAQGSLEILHDLSTLKLLDSARKNNQDSYEDRSESDAYEEKETSDEYELLSKDELSRVHDDGRYERPGNFYAGMFYDDHDEIYRIAGDWDSRIGGSSLG